MSLLEEQIVTGLTEDHLVEVPGGKIHKDAVGAFHSLTQAAKRAGFDLQLASSFRGFSRQLTIWNLKATGQRPLFNSRGEPIDFSSLTEKEIVFSILRWSALPGASRHHWGTDLDVYDAAALPPGYQVQLTPAEVATEGIFGPLHDWLDDNLATHGFFRPYTTDRKGVAPERWHLSYAPVAERYLNQMTIALVEKNLKPAAMDLKTIVLENLTTIFRQFIKNVDPAPKSTPR